MLKLRRESFQKIRHLQRFVLKLERLSEVFLRNAKNLELNC